MKSKRKIGLIGCGWLGMPLSIHLRKLGHQLRVLSSSNKNDELLLREGITKHQLVHSEFKLSLSFFDDLDYLILSFPPFRNVAADDYLNYVENLLRHCSKKTTVIYTSSVGVYKKGNERIDEDGTIDESTLVAQTEKLIQGSISPSIILRLGGLFGPNRHPVFSIVKRGSFQNPHGVINYVHQKDVIRAVETLIQEDQESSIYNLVHPNHPERKAYFENAAKYFNLGILEEIETEIVRNYVDGDRIEKSTAFRYAQNPTNFSDI